MILFPINWYAGWGLVLAAFVSGAAIGMFFHREQYLGGYGSFPRRILRLGHISLAALGMMNVLFALAVPASPCAHAGSILLVIGGVSMPSVCFLTAWKMTLRHLFFLPVVSLMLAVALVLAGGIP